MKISNKEWFDLICKSYFNRTVSFNNILLPYFPSDQIQINTTGQCGVNTLREAFIFYEDCINFFKDIKGNIFESDNILDFGIGWGRIARFFLKDILKDNIYGLDVTDEFINICKETFDSDNFFLSDPFPPCKFENNKFDYIIGYSIFSHLSEKACKEWMAEFYRITKPGALLALTTRGRSFFDYCERLKKSKAEGYSRALSLMFSNFNEARKLYDSGFFVHSNREGVNGGGRMTSEFYGETFIPKEYAEKEYSSYFTLKKFLFDEKRQSHPIMFFRRK
jgi:ubiquinone/menaquinone biosynthesis C-methylase UbiE